MAYDEALAERIREAIRSLRGVTEKQMFGGVAFMMRGKMFCGVVGDELMVRIGPEAYEAALTEAHVRPMDFTGRPMKGYVFVSRRGLATGAALKKWIDRGASFVLMLGKGVARPRPRRSVKA